MNILNFSDVVNYLQYKQVYFKKEICNADFKTLAAPNRVHDIGRVEAKRLNDNTCVIHMEVNGNDVSIYEYKTDLELFAFVKTRFIPVSVLVEKY